MELREVIGRRRSIRFLLPYKPVEPEKIQRMLEAARIASHWGNVQSLRAVVVFRDSAPREVLDALQAPIAGFLAERKRLAADLRAAGDSDGAERIAKHPKPTTSVWAVNQLYWQARDGFDEMLEAASRMRICNTVRTRSLSIRGSSKVLWVWTRALSLSCSVMGAARGRPTTFSFADPAATCSDTRPKSTRLTDTIRA